MSLQSSCPQLAAMFCVSDSFGDESLIFFRQTPSFIHNKVYVGDLHMADNTAAYIGTGCTGCLQHPSIERNSLETWMLSYTKWNFSNLPHLYCLPILLQISENSEQQVYSVTCCVTCDYVTNIPYIASFYCCKNCVDLDLRNFGSHRFSRPVFCLSSWDNLLIHGGSVCWTLTVYCLVDERRRNHDWSSCGRFEFAFYSRFESSYGFSSAITASKTSSTAQSGRLLGEKVEAMETKLA